MVRHHVPNTTIVCSMFYLCLESIEKEVQKAGFVEKIDRTDKPLAKVMKKIEDINYQYQE